MEYLKLAIDAELFVKKLFETFAHNEFPYHNLEHTTQVAAHTREIGSYYFLREEDLFVTTVAAWFHDIGHLFGPMEEHEENGAQIMHNFFSDKEIPAGLPDAIADCILATKWPSAPRTLNEKILCDADTYHFGTPYFKKTDPAVQKEMEQRFEKCFSNWHQKSLSLLQSHHFFTIYCKQKLEAGKQENIAWLQSLIDAESKAS